MIDGPRIAAAATFGDRERGKPPRGLRRRHPVPKRVEEPRVAAPGGPEQRREPLAVGEVEIHHVQAAHRQPSAALAEALHDRRVVDGRAHDALVDEVEGAVLASCVPPPV